MSQILAVVIPAYKVRDHILKVLDSIGPEVDAIYVVDDACPENCGALVHEQCQDMSKVYRQSHTGVGGAVIRGIRAALDDEATVIVKIDGDGHGSSSYLP